MTTDILIYFSGVLVVILQIHLINEYLLKKIGMVILFPMEVAIIFSIFSYLMAAIIMVFLILFLLVVTLLIVVSTIFDTVFNIKWYKDFSPKFEGI